MSVNWTQQEPQVKHCPHAARPRIYRLLTGGVEWQLCAECCAERIKAQQERNAQGRAQRLRELDRLRALD